MCGIAGALTWQTADPCETEALVAAMTRALTHRGPDGQGVTRCALAPASPGPAAVALGHTRLAILDLTARGRQPMTCDAAPVWITYNGEVYNFEAIRAELEARGRTFVSRTDTEVILQGYVEWGTGIIGRLRGMFAFAIWDGRTNELVLARDRMGIKPLYVHRSARGVLFASEVRALLASRVPEPRLDRTAVDHFLAYQSVPPPRTLVADIQMVRPGHWLRVGATPDAFEAHAYWDALDHVGAQPAGTTAEEARTEVRRLLTESARLHLISDVPVGIFLSGGIDSSALVALARADEVTPRTFTVVLPGTPLDEAPFARAIADAFDADHEEIHLDASDLARDIPDAVARIDHPSGDGVNTFIVSRAVRRAGVKVALSGLGGDELFGGYPSFRRMQRLSAYGGAFRRSPAAVRRAAAAAVRTVGRRSVASVKAAAVLESDGSLARAFPLMRELFSRQDRQDLLASSDVAAGDGRDPYVELVEQAVARHPDGDVMSLVSYAELCTYMHDVLLRDTDQMSMAHGLEVRVPFVDHGLVEYVIGLPEAAKVSEGRAKALLVESLGAELPRACIDRPKQGFVLPFDQWMRGELREFCEHALGPDGLGRAGLFSEPAVARLWAAFLGGAATTSWSRPWALVALGGWMADHGVRG